MSDDAWKAFPMTDDGHARVNATPSEEVGQIMAEFRAARDRMAADPGMAGRIASLADKTDYAVGQLQYAADSLDRAFGVLRSLTQGHTAAAALAAQGRIFKRKQPRLKRPSAPITPPWRQRGTTDEISPWERYAVLRQQTALDRAFDILCFLGKTCITAVVKWGRVLRPEKSVLDTRPKLLRLAAELNWQANLAGEVVGALEDNLDIALGGVACDVDAFTHARVKREAARESRRLADSAFHLAAGLTSNHAEAAELRVAIVCHGGAEGRENSAFLTRISKLKNTVATSLREAVELAVGLADGDLDGTCMGQLDVSGADLAHVNLSGAFLEGLLWSDSTRWPPGEEYRIRERSRRIGGGVYQVTEPGPYPDRRWKPESMQA